MLHIGTQTIETERLLLRKYSMDDADDMFANWVTDREAIRFWGWEPHKDISETRTLLKQWIEEYQYPEIYHWVIVLKETMQAIGYIYLSSIDNVEKSAEVHFLLSRMYWNQGIMTEACRRVIEFAFSEVGFEKISSYHHIENPASGKVMQKCGMSLVKTEYRISECERLSGEYCFYDHICVVNHNH